MRLYLIRHGQTPSNVQRVLDTDAPGPGLTALGRIQAEALPEALRGAGIESLYASTLVRTQLTAAPLSEALGLEVAVRAGLREIRAGNLEKAGDDESVQAYLDAVFAWSRGGLGQAVPGSGEDGHAVLARFDEVVREIEDTGVTTAALFSHGALIRAWSAARCRNVSVPFAMSRGLTNTGVVVIDGTPGSWTALTWMDEALGGAAVDTGAGGPAGDPVPPQPIRD